MRHIRRPYIGLTGILFFLFQGASASPVYLQPVELIEATPMDNFTARPREWPTERRSAEATSLSETSVLESANEIPGVQGREGGSPLLSIRGSGSYGRVLGLFDGISLNLGDGFGAQRLLIPREIIDEVTILKGPGSVFYGRDAMGGSLQFRPRKLTSGIARGGGESFGRRNILLASPLERPSDSGEFSQVSLFHEDEDGQYAFRIPRVGIEGVRSRNDHSLDRVTVLAHKRLGDFEIQPRFILAREIGSTPGSVLKPAADPSGTFNRSGTLASFTLKGPKLFHELAWNYRLNYLNIEADTYADIFQSTYFNRSQRFQNSLSLVQSLGPTTLEYFADSYYDDYREIAGTTPVSPQLQYFDHSVELGIVGSTPLFDRWVFQPGTRYLTRFGSWVSSLGLTQDLETQKVWATYSESFRSPGLSDLYSQALTFKGNPNLKPERSHQIEVGFQKKSLGFQARNFWEGAQYGLSVFGTTYDNLFRTSGNTKVNEDKATGQGVEFNIGYAWSVTTVQFEIATLQTESERTHRTLPISPEYQASLVIDHQLGPVVFELRDTQWGKYYDQEYATNELVELAPWNTADFTVRTLGLSGWVFRGGVLNILDTPRELTLGYPEPQRRFFASVERSLW